MHVAWEPQAERAAGLPPLDAGQRITPASAGAPAAHRHQRVGMFSPTRVKLVYAMHLEVPYFLQDTALTVVGNSTRVTAGTGVTKIH
jgi:hypothetical protein